MLSGFTAVSSNDFTQLYRRLVGCRVVIWIWFLSIFAATVIILPLGYLTFDLHSETKKWTEISLISCWKMFRWRTNTFFSLLVFLSPHFPSATEDMNKKSSSLIRTVTETECYDWMSQNKVFTFFSVVSVAVAAVWEYKWWGLCEAQAHVAEQRAHRLCR